MSYNYEVYGCDDFGYCGDEGYAVFPRRSQSQQPSIFSPRENWGQERQPSLGGIGNFQLPNLNPFPCPKVLGKGCQFWSLAGLGIGVMILWLLLSEGNNALKSVGRLS
jgi:hypothetical protein